MSRFGLLGLVATALAVLVLVGSMIEGVSRGPGSTGPTLQEDEAEDSAGERVRVEVLNAAGLTGLARAATVQIREAGYDVVYYGNAAAFDRDTSLVLDRSGRPDAARAVAAAVDIPLVAERPDSSLYLDVTVIIGRDWAGIPAAPDSVPR